MVHDPTSRESQPCNRRNPNICLGHLGEADDPGGMKGAPVGTIEDRVERLERDVARLEGLLATAATRIAGAGALLGSLAPGEGSVEHEERVDLVPRERRVGEDR